MNTDSVTLSLNHRKKNKNSWAIAGLIMVCEMLLTTALKWITITPGDLVGYAIFIFGIAIVGALSNRYEVIDVTLKNFSAYFRFFGWLLVTLGPLRKL